MSKYLSYEQSGVSIDNTGKWSMIENFLTIFSLFMKIELDKMNNVGDNIITSLVGKPSGPRARKHARAFLLRTPN